MSVLTSVLVVGLVAGTVAVGDAEESEKSRLVASAFEATLRRTEEPSIDDSAGPRAQATIRVDATDARASGLLTVVSLGSAVCSEAEDGTVVWGTTCGRVLPLHIVVRSGVRLVNEDGTWAGTQVYFAGAELETEVSGGFMELTGEGGYQGLTMLATLRARGMDPFTPKTMSGIIIPTEAVPARTELHAE